MGAARALNPCRPFIVSASGRRAYNMRRTFFNWASSRRARHSAELRPRVKHSSLRSNALADVRLKRGRDCKICTRRTGGAPPPRLRRSQNQLGWWRATPREAECFTCEHGGLFRDSAVALGRMVTETKGAFLTTPARSPGSAARPITSSELLMHLRDVGVSVRERVCVCWQTYLTLWIQMQ